jgi:hypothetical protein
MRTASVMGTQTSTPWIIQAPVTATSAEAVLGGSSMIALAVQLFVLVHARRLEEPLMLSILPELIRRMSDCNDCWAARIVMECIMRFHDDRGKIIKSMEVASVSLSILQLYGEVVKRFPSILSAKQMRQPGHEIVADLKVFTRVCNYHIGQISDRLFAAENVAAGISALQTSLGKKMVQYPVHGLCLLSDTTTEWVVVISELEQTITMVSKLLFELDDENTTLSHWAYTVKAPSGLSEKIFIDEIEAAECQWWRDYILDFLPFNDSLSDLLKNLTLT